MKVHFGENCYRQVESQFDNSHCDSQTERSRSLQISIVKINFTSRS